MNHNAPVPSSSGYHLHLSDGHFLTTVIPKTINTRQNSSLVLIGKGIPDEWKWTAQNSVWMLENFSASRPPPNPLIGQTWHDRSRNRMNFFTGTGWRPLVADGSTSQEAFDMLPSAVGIDMTTAASIPIFSVLDFAKTYFPTTLFLVPQGEVSATTPATINISALTGGDILESRSISLTEGQYARVSLNQWARIVDKKNPTVFINVTTPASGGQLRCSAFLFGVGPSQRSGMAVEQVPESGYGAGTYGLGLYGQGGTPETFSYGADLYGLGPYGGPVGTVIEILSATDDSEATVIPLVPDPDTFGAGSYGVDLYGTGGVPDAGSYGAGLYGVDGYSGEIVMMETATAVDLADATVTHPPGSYGAGLYGANGYSGEPVMETAPAVDVSDATVTHPPGSYGSGLYGSGNYSS